MKKEHLSQPPTNFTIYVTNAGKTATLKHIDYFGDADNYFNPNKFVVLTSPDVIDKVESNMLETNPGIMSNTKFVILTNPYFGNQDYLPALSEMVGHIKAFLLEALQNTPPGQLRPRIVINGSGGTTKFSFLMEDLSMLLSSITVCQVQTFFGTFDLHTKKVIFTEKPQLARELLQELLQLNNDERLNKNGPSD